MTTTTGQDKKQRKDIVKSGKKMNKSPVGGVVA
jgi:hypothetical protein